MKCIYLVLCSILLIVSCNNTQLDYQLKASDNEINQEGLALIEDMIEEIQDFEGIESDLEANVLEYEVVNIADVVASLFNPENFKCPLPGKVKDKLAADSSWAPPFIVGRINDMNKKVAFHFKEQGLAVILNTITYKRLNGQEYLLRVLGAPSYSNLDIHNYIDESRSEFIYSLDYSGYLSAALSFSATGSKRSIQSAAELAMKDKGMLMLARGHVFSPLLVALRPSSFPNNISQDNRYRLSTLYAILRALPQDVDENDKILAPIELDVLWSSVSGDSNFNGEGSLKSKVNGGFAFITTSGSFEAGASISKQASFRDVETYVIDTVLIENVSPVRIKEIRSVLKFLTSRAIVEEPAEIVNDKIKFTVQFPGRFVDLDWVVLENGYSVEVVLENESKYCAFTINGPSNISDKVITIQSIFNGTELTRRISLP